MNLSPRWIGRPAQAGFEAAHWSAVGARDAPDAEIMAYAAANGFMVITHDLDFSAILAATLGDRPSVIQIRSGDLSPDIVGGPVTAALRQLEAELAVGALLTVEPARTRLRVLPLRSGR